jgi:beta-1,2-mannobiose phosphorylase / 1,2-beta-oligomannan phosphorylase
MYYGVGRRETVGVYRTSWALPDLDDPRRILRLEDEQPVLEANRSRSYLPTSVVFTTGVADAGDHYIVASGEVDLACRITHMPKALFA